MITLLELGVNMKKLRILLVSIALILMTTSAHANIFRIRDVRRSITERNPKRSPKSACEILTKVYGLSFIIGTNGVFYFGPYKDGLWYDDNAITNEHKTGFGIKLDLPIIGRMARPVAKLYDPRFWAVDPALNPWKTPNRWFSIRMEAFPSAFFSLGIWDGGFYLGSKRFSIDRADHNWTTEREKRIIEQMEDKRINALCPSATIRRSR